MAKIGNFQLAAFLGNIGLRLIRAFQTSSGAENGEVCKPLQFIFTA